jgi:hypothetical protein
MRLAYDGRDHRRAVPNATSQVGATPVCLGLSRPGQIHGLGQLNTILRTGVLAHKEEDVASNEGGLMAPIPYQMPLELAPRSLGILRHDIDVCGLPPSFPPPR